MGHWLRYAAFTIQSNLLAEWKVALQSHLFFSFTSFLFGLKDNDILLYYISLDSKSLILLAMKEKITARHVWQEFLKLDFIKHLMRLKYFLLTSNFMNSKSLRFLLSKQTMFILIPSCIISSILAIIISPFSKSYNKI